MTLQVDIRSNIKQIEKNLGFFAKKQIPLATITAINRTATSVRAEAVRQAKKEFGRSDIKMSELRKKTFIYKANKKKQFAIIRFRKAIFKLKRFKPVQTAQGVVAHAYNATKLYKGTFLAPVGMGRTKGVFKRDKSSRRRGDIKRVKSGANIGQSYRPALPIKELYGSDFQKTVFKNKTVRKIIANKIKIQFPKELLRALKYRATKVRRR